jgi:SAM-dependent methyltransferase
MQASYGREYTLAQARRSWGRKLVRRAYLNHARSLLKGPTLDFGCGVGELLERLPSGSAGVEYNHSSVEYCRARGLHVDWYDGYADDWSLASCTGRFQSLIVSHVLEHFDEPMPILGKLIAAATGRGIERVLVIVPGRAGFRHDNTHRTFVDRPMLREELARHPAWHEAQAHYFPLPIESAGNWFTYNELHFLAVRTR